MIDNNEEEMDALAGAVDMELDWNIPVPKEEMEMYREYVNRKQRGSRTIQAPRKINISQIQMKEGDA